MAILKYWSLYWSTIQTKKKIKKKQDKSQFKQPRTMKVKRKWYSTYVLRLLNKFKQKKAATKESKITLKALPRSSSGFGGGSDGAVADPSPQGFDPLPTQRVPLCTILRYPYLVTDPKIFLKAPWAPIYTKFEGGARAEKTQFLAKFFQECPKTLFWPVFWKICLRRRKFCQYRVFGVIWESSEYQFGRPKKKVGKNFDFFFWKSAPSRNF